MCLRIGCYERWHTELTRRRRHNICSLPFCCDFYTFLEIRDIVTKRVAWFQICIVQ